MISEGSCDTEYWNKKLQKIQQEKISSYQRFLLKH